jgi:hypothetical protein
VVLMMFSVYLGIAVVLAFTGGGILIFAIAFTKVDPSTPKVIALAFCPVAAYWLGIVVTFLCILGKAFKAG